MKLYFLRHAHAEVAATSDHDRRLTARGLRAAHNAARVLAALEIKPTHVFTSPRVRALQTAEIVAKALKVEPETREEVNFGFGLTAVKKLIEGLSNDSEVLFVGHEPTLSLTIGELTSAKLQMKKAGFARIDLSNQAPLRGELVWLIPPKVFEVMDAEA